jgi:hypothetical protein
MRAIPLILAVLILAGLGYAFRETISGWFTGPSGSDVQTVVLRQTATPTATVPNPTPIPTPNLPASGSIALIASPTPQPVAGPLPTTGPVEDLVVAGAGALVLGALWRWATQPSTVIAQKPDIR